MGRYYGLYNISYFDPKAFAKRQKRIAREQRMQDIRAEWGGPLLWVLAGLAIVGLVWAFWVYWTTGGIR